MKNAIIIHGLVEKEEYFDDSTLSPSKSHWIPWLKSQLQSKGIEVETPEMPEPWSPNYEKWKTTFEKLNLGDNTILVGHSCGGGFVLRYLSENRLKVGKVVLAAPWIDPDGVDKDILGDFFDFNIDSTLIDRVNELDIFVSVDDDLDIIKSVEVITSNIKNCNVYKFEDRGHFTEEDMGSCEFPELLKVITN